MQNLNIFDEATENTKTEPIVLELTDKQRRLIKHLAKERNCTEQELFIELLKQEWIKQNVAFIQSIFQDEESNKMQETIDKTSSKIIEIIKECWEKEMDSWLEAHFEKKIQD